MGWLSKTRIWKGVEDGVEELKACGTTHVADVTATWQSVEPLLDSSLRGIVHLEVQGLRRWRALARLDDAKAAIRRIRAHPSYGSMQVGLALHAPYSCYPDLLRESAKWCRIGNIPLCIHVARSLAETELLLDGHACSVRGRIRLFARLLGIWPSSSPRLRPLTYLASLGVLTARPLLVHGIRVTDEEIRIIGDMGCAVVHCPRSEERLSCGRMPLERYLNAGVPVYLGTDGRASSPSLDVHTEVEFAQRLHAGKVDAERVAELIHRALPC